MAAIKEDISFWHRDRGLVIAADVGTLDELRQLAELASEFTEVVALKVGFTLALRFGLPEVVKAAKGTSDKIIIYDHQKASTDIPQMGKPFADACSDSGVDSVIFFPLAGPRTLEGFVSAALAVDLHPIVGLAMTHKAYFQSEGGFIADSSPEIIIEIATKSGVASFVLPGTKTDVVSKFAKGQLADCGPANIFMPGIGSQGGSIAAAFEAASPHACFAIIGSAIYKSDDPKAALAAFVEEVNR